MGLIQRAAAAAERTPDERNRHADLLRVAAIGAVVVGVFLWFRPVWVLMLALASAPIGALLAGFVLLEASEGSRGERA